jgi:hypothetical protein
VVTTARSEWEKARGQHSGRVPASVARGVKRKGPDGKLTLTARCHSRTVRAPGRQGRFASRPAPGTATDASQAGARAGARGRTGHHRTAGTHRGRTARTRRRTAHAVVRHHPLHAGHDHHRSIVARVAAGIAAAAGAAAAAVVDQVAVVLVVGHPVNVRQALVVVLEGVIVVGPEFLQPGLFRRRCRCRRSSKPGSCQYSSPARRRHRRAQESVSSCLQLEGGPLTVLTTGRAGIMFLRAPGPAARARPCSVVRPRHEQ